MLNRVVFGEIGKLLVVRLHHGKRDIQPEFEVRNVEGKREIPGLPQEVKKTVNPIDEIDPV